MLPERTILANRSISGDGVRTADSSVARLAGELSEALRAAEFHATGAARGRTDGVEWVMVDPERHPLTVWQRRSRAGGYGATARGLRATVFTNGPYMGRHTRAGVAIRLAAGTGGGLLVALSTRGGGALTRGGGALACGEGALACGEGAPARAAAPPAHGRDAPALRRHGARWSELASALAWASAGLLAVWRVTFAGWIPCGVIRGRNGAIVDDRDFHGEGVTHAWFGRRGPTFPDHAIGLGDPPPDWREAMGGLVPLVLEGRDQSRSEGSTPAHADAARVAGKRKVVAWALLPASAVAPMCPLAGVLLVLGTTTQPASRRLGTVLAGLGVHGAVATDTGGCAMLGHGSRFLIGPPWPHRQRIQRYGLCCGAARTISE